jgi:hypothetical protein
MVKVRQRDIAAEIEKRYRAAVNATAERYRAWAQQAEARGWLEAAARHRAAASRRGGEAANRSVNGWRRHTGVVAR